MIKALLFDIDGTLFDTNEANAASYKAAFKDVGLPFPEKLYRDSFGLRFPEIMKRLLPKGNDEQLSRIKTLKAKYYKTNLKLIKPNTGLIALALSTTHGYATGLVTTASKTNILNLLKHFSIDPNQFSVVITGEDVKHGKPNPECYVQAIKQLGVQPAECVVFEDSIHGIQAAEAAGTQVIKVTVWNKSSDSFLFCCL